MDALPHQAARPHRLAPVPHPAGIDGYSSSHGSGTCRDDVTPFLKEAYEKPFLALLEHYRDILQDRLAGHTHMDDFRVLAARRASRSC